jgi:hypothetical protein
VIVRKWLQVEYLAGDGWALSILAAVNRAAEQRQVGALTDELRQLGLHVATRLGMIEALIGRINSGARRLEELIGSREPHHEFMLPRNGYVFHLPADFKYTLLVDLDALLFEVNSCCELMRRLFEKVYEHAGRVLPRAAVGLTIRQVLEAAGQDAGWFVKLDKHRNFFIHDGVPYFAVDLSEAEAGKYDLLTMKSNLQSFENEAQFVRYSELQWIVGGFQKSRTVIQQHLAGLFA